MSLVAAQTDGWNADETRYSRCPAGPTRRARTQATQSMGRGRDLKPGKKRAGPADRRLGQTLPQGGAGPRAAITDKKQRSAFAQLRKPWIRSSRLAVVMIPPCPSPSRSARDYAHVQVFRSVLGSASCRRLRQSRRHEARAYVHIRQALTKSKLKQRTIRHDFPFPIFDELEYELLLKTAGGPAAA